MTLACPFLDIVHAIDDTGALDFVVGHSLLKLEEVSGYTTFLIAQVRYIHFVLFQNAEELIAEAFQLFYSFFFQCLEHSPIVGDTIGVLQRLAELCPFLDVLFVEDILAEFLDFMSHLPLLVVFNAFFDIIQQLVEDG